jgi:predicted site-specific integrase-resolvase
MEPEKLLTLKEAADRLRISIRTLYNWRSARIIDGDKRYTESYVEEIKNKFIKGQLIV